MDFRTRDFTIPGVSAPRSFDPRNPEKGLRLLAPPFMRPPYDPRYDLRPNPKSVSGLRDSRSRKTSYLRSSDPQNPEMSISQIDNLQP
jgi:hypothetical protein